MNIIKSSQQQSLRLNRVFDLLTVFFILFVQPLLLPIFILQYKGNWPFLLQILSRFTSSFKHGPSSFCFSRDTLPKLVYIEVFFAQMTAQFLFEGQMLLIMFIPFLMIANGRSYLQQTIKQLSIFFPDFFIHLLFFEARVQRSSFLLGNLPFFFERLRQNTWFMVVDIEEGNQHLFVFDLAMPVLFVGSFVMMVQRDGLSRSEVHFDCEARVQQMLVMRLLLLIEHHRIYLFISVRHLFLFYQQYNHTYQNCSWKYLRRLQ